MGFDFGYVLCKSKETVLVELDSAGTGTVQCRNDCEKETKREDHILPKYTISQSYTIKFGKSHILSCRRLSLRHRTTCNTPRKISFQQNSYRFMHLCRTVLSNCDMCFRGTQSRENVVRYIETYKKGKITVTITYTCSIGCM